MWPLCNRLFTKIGSTDGCNENSGIGKWQGSLGDTSPCMLLLPLTTESRNTSTTLLEMHFFSGAQHSFILIIRSLKTSDSWFVCFWKMSFFPGLFSVSSRQKVVSCLQEISKGQKSCYVSLEGALPSFLHYVQVVNCSPCAAYLL